MQNARLTFHKQRRIARVPDRLLLTPGLRKRKGRALVFELWNEQGQIHPDHVRIRQITNQIVKLNLK